MNKEVDTSASFFWVIVEGFGPSTSLDMARDFFKQEHSILTVEPRRLPGQFLLLVQENPAFARFWVQNQSPQFSPRCLKFTVITREESRTIHRNFRNPVAQKQTNNLEYQLMVATLPAATSEIYFHKFLESEFGRVTFFSPLSVLSSKYNPYFRPKEAVKNIQFELNFRKKALLRRLVGLMELPDFSRVWIQHFGPVQSAQQRSEPPLRHFKEVRLPPQPIPKDPSLPGHETKTEQDSPHIKALRIAAKKSRIDINASAHDMKPTSGRYFKLRPRLAIPINSSLCFRLRLQMQ